MVGCNGVGVIIVGHGCWCNYSRCWCNYSRPWLVGVGVIIVVGVGVIIVGHGVGVMV